MNLSQLHRLRPLSGTTTSRQTDSAYNNVWNVTSVVYPRYFGSYAAGRSGDKSADTIIFVTVALLGDRMVVFSVHTADEHDVTIETGNMLTTTVISY